MLAYPVYVPFEPVNVPSVKVPAVIVPDIFTLLFKSTVTVPTFPATAAAVTVILLSPKNFKSSVDKFNTLTVFVLSVYSNVFDPAALST